MTISTTVVLLWIPNSLHFIHFVNFVLPNTSAWVGPCYHRQRFPQLEFFSLGSLTWCSCFSDPLCFASSFRFSVYKVFPFRFYQFAHIPGSLISLQFVWCYTVRVFQIKTLKIVFNLISAVLIAVSCFSSSFSWVLTDVPFLGVPE